MNLTSRRHTMAAMTATKGDAAIRSRLAVALLLAGALFTMGAKWAEQPIRDFQSVAGDWRGSGRTARNKVFSLKLTIKEDGSLRTIANWSGGSNDLTWTMRLNEGKIQFEGTNGQTVTVTLSSTRVRKGSVG